MTILMAVCCLGIAFACRGNREDREQECGTGEICENGGCRDPCGGNGWRIVTHDPQVVCHDHGFCKDEHCKKQCANDASGQKCQECRNNHECHDTFCCGKR